MTKNERKLAIKVLENRRDVLRENYNHANRVAACYEYARNDCRSYLRRIKVIERAIFKLKMDLS